MNFTIEKALAFDEIEAVILKASKASQAEELTLQDGLLNTLNALDDITKIVQAVNHLIIHELESTTLTKKMEVRTRYASYQAGY